MKVILAGAGPGDPGLFTIKGRQALEKADVVIYDALANPVLLDYVKKGAELIYVGKVASQHALPQDQINELLAKKAREAGGKTVVRLKGGDPYIFGRGGEEADYLVGQGIPFEEIPGITSAIAAPAYAGIPLTHRGFTSALTIVTGHENPLKGKTSINWFALARGDSTLVFVMGMKNLARIAENLITEGMDPETPAAVIYQGTTPFQKTVQAPLKKLAEAAKNLTNPAVIVIGHVVAMRQKLDWFSTKPLLGKNIVVTRAREQASGMAMTLEELGAVVIQCPTIEIRPLTDYALLDAAIDQLHSYNWIIFTSANGIEYFWQRLAAAGKDSRSLGCAKIAAIGPATAKKLQTKGINADFIPDSYIAESVAEGMMKCLGKDIKDMRILLPRAKTARQILPEALAQAGAIVDVAPAYETVAAGHCGENVKKLLLADHIDCISFGSSSTVHNFMDIVSPDLLMQHPNTKLAVIGPITAATLSEYGLQADIMPDQFTIPALVKAITGYFNPEGCSCP